MENHIGLFLLRVWLPDRPGALGQVAGRIGAVKGDVVAIDILERDGGEAVDELVVALPDPALLDLMVAEVRQVDGVRVEEARPAEAHYDPRLDALEAVGRVVAADNLVDLYDVVVAQCCLVVKADWAVLVDVDPHGNEVAARFGEAPSGAWLRAYVAGSVAAGSSTAGGDVAWAPLPSAALALVVGREGLAFRTREVRHLAALARVADTRRRELSRSRSRAAHPSAR